MVTYLAPARLQVCRVPLDAASADAEIAHVVRDCGMRALFVSAAQAGALEGTYAGRVLSCPDGAVPRARPVPGREARHAAPAGAACLAYPSVTRLPGTPANCAPATSATSATQRALFDPATTRP
ncbi:hypothetical protein GCM10022419_031660 [Nonomuraea rosea]|uniref:Uncharacterized protein n=1 Tax=Nonomuraea rosea TaxID=638574 RepID=A0ABP6WBD1_9ACTN